VNISAHSSTPLSSITATTNKPNSNATAEKNAAEHTPEELKQIKQLKLRDQEVRSHEAAHLAAGQGITKGSASFSYQRGPDGVQYAIGGEVKIDASEVAGDPEATLAIIARSCRCSQGCQNGNRSPSRNKSTTKPKIRPRI
jgi:hypothetical protein